MRYLGMLILSVMFVSFASVANEEGVAGNPQGNSDTVATGDAPKGKVEEANKNKKKDTKPKPHNK